MIKKLIRRILGTKDKTPRATAPLVLGDPATVHRELLELAARTGADELMITTMVHGAEDRLRSYELVGDVFELSPVDSLS